MRKLIAFLTAIACLSFLPVLTGNAASSLACTNPKKLTSYSGTIHFPPLTVQQDVWSPRNGTKQTMLVCSPKSWSATVTQTGQPSDGVATYPDSGTTYPDNCAQTHPLSAYKTMTSSYAEQSPTAASAYDWGYDLFLGGKVCNQPFTEVMVWNQWAGLSVPKAQIRTTIGGVAYDIFHAKGYIQVRRHVQNAAGTVNLGLILASLTSRGLIGNVNRIFVQYGVEVLTTYGAAVPFTLTNFSVTDTFK